MECLGMHAAYVPMSWQNMIRGSITTMVVSNSRCWPMTFYKEAFSNLEEDFEIVELLGKPE